MKSLRTLCRTITVAACVLLVGVVTISASTVVTHEFWVSTNAVSGNVGTLSDPFIGSTQARFDAIMSAIPAYSTVHLLQGTYETSGGSGWTLKTGEKIIGSGINITTIHLTNNSPQGSVGITTGGSGGYTNITVSDLTLDESGSTNVHGMMIWGGRINISRTKVTNLNSVGGGNEVFGIALWGNDFYTEGNIVEDCELTNLNVGAVGGFSAIAIGGDTNYTSAIVRNNRIMYSPNADQPLLGINIVFNYNTLITGNLIKGASAAVYSDSGSNTNVLITHNDFVNCAQGAVFHNSAQTGIICSFNMVDLGYASYGSTAFGFDANSTYTNLVIYGNTVDIFGTASPAVTGVYGTTAHGLSVSENVFATNCTFITSGSSGVNLYNNVDPSGKPLVQVNQVEPPNGFTRTTVTTSPYTLGYGDDYVGVQRSATLSTTINLPSATSYSGKQYKIVQEGALNAGQSITIAAPSGQTVNGAGSVSISTAYQGSTVISDGANWFAR